MIWGNDFELSFPSGCTLYVANWPRGSYDLSYPFYGRGFLALAKKNGNYLASYADVYDFSPHTLDPSYKCSFNQTVPGRIGDAKAGFDTVYHGSGWKYVDDRDYIVYSNMDYDSNGVDISGNNFNDWPIRTVGGARKYVAEPLDRHNYSPVYVSDEDMFCVFKDTDTRADHNYAGKGGPSEPIGLEIHHYVYSWGSGPLKDIVLFRYQVINKSGSYLDSCYFLFAPGILLAVGGSREGDRSIGSYPQQPSRNLSYLYPLNKNTWTSWKATPTPPTIGFPLLETPRGYDGLPLGLTRIDEWENVENYPKDPLKPNDPNNWIVLGGASDSMVYRRTVSPNPSDVTTNPVSSLGPALLTGPYPMQPNDTARFTIAFIFADSLADLLLLDDLIMRMYSRDLQRPIPPPPSKLTATGLDRSVKLSWDNGAESAIDPIIPDSLGKPFKGYRLLRAQAKNGPFVQIGRWTEDSTIVYEHLDKGTDIGGLKNNVQYYYQLLSFDEGAKLLKLDPMESKALDGINARSVIPSTEPLNPNESLDKIQIVPNPYFVTHEAQQSGRQLYFNYLPDECTIRIYTVALDLVKTIHHQGGSREVWNLQTEGGQIVASQMLYAHIETTYGKKTIKRFGVIVGK
jgi:hypothetical protein